MIIKRVSDFDKKWRNSFRTLLEYVRRYKYEHGNIVFLRARTKEWLRRKPEHKAIKQISYYTRSTGQTYGMICAIEFFSGETVFLNPTGNFNDDIKWDILKMLCLTLDARREQVGDLSDKDVDRLRRFWLHWFKTETCKISNAITSAGCEGDYYAPNRYDLLIKLNINHKLAYFKLSMFEDHNIRIETTSRAATANLDIISAIITHFLSSPANCNKLNQFAEIIGSSITCRGSFQDGFHNLWSIRAFRTTLKESANIEEFILKSRLEGIHGIDAEYMPELSCVKIINEVEVKEDVMHTKG